MASKDLGAVTAYAYAVDGGYTGTEEEFTAELSRLGITLDEFENFSVEVNTLDAGTQATASYEDGVLTLGIPKGHDGEVTEESLGHTLEDYARIDGAYEGMTAGNAEQLVSTIFTEDKVPYLFRTSGGSSDIGDREEDEIVGGSVVWNQLIPTQTQTREVNGITFTANADGTVTANGTATADATYVCGYLSLVAHTYLVRGCPAGGSSSTYNFGVSDYGNGYILKRPSSTGFSFQIVIKSGTTVSNKKFCPNVHDLTAMFGTAIADQIYALEQANAGAGVALFRSMFPKDYYPYNEGELMSVKTSAHEMVGFNQWDEEWEVGDLSGTDGTPIASSTFIRSTNFSRCLPNTVYFLNKGSAQRIYIFWYDENETHISHAVAFANRTMTSPEGAKYFKLTIEGTTYNHDICINLSWSGWRNGEYEPYVKHSYPLDNIELRGIPKLDANGDIYFDGDTYESDGTVTRRYGIVDLGTLTWFRDSVGDNWSFYIDVNALPNAKVVSTVDDKANFLMPKYTVVPTRGNTGYATDGVVFQKPNTQVFVVDKSHTDATAFKTAMSGVYLVYELEEPTTETATPFTNPQIVDDFGTERYVDERDIPVPVGHVTKYLANLRDKLQHLPDLAGADGAYLIRQTGHQMSLDVFRIPKAPTEDGTYTLKATVSGGTPTYTWESESNE